MTKEPSERSRYRTIWSGGAEILAPGATDEERAAFYADKKRERHRDRWIAVAVLTALVLVVLGIALVRAWLVYDDWRCAFAECRILK